MHAGAMKRGAMQTVDNSGCVLFRDGNHIEPPDESYWDTEGTLDNPYVPNSDAQRDGLPVAHFKPMPQDEWLHDPNELDEDEMMKVKEVVAPSLLAIVSKKLRTAYPPILNFIDSGPVLVVFMLMTFWALFASEVHLATTTSSKYDVPFAWVSLTFMVLFGVEVLLRCLCQPLYFSVEFFGKCRGPGFFFVLDLIATATMAWDVMPAFEDTTEKFAQAARLKTQVNALTGVTQSLN